MIMCIYTCLHTYAYIYMYVYICIYIYIYIYIYTYMYIYMYVYIYIYIYICLYIHVCMCIYTYINSESYALLLEACVSTKKGRFYAKEIVEQRKNLGLLNKDEWDRLLELYIISNGPVNLPVTPVIIPVIPIVSVNLVPEPVTVKTVKPLPLKPSTQAVNFFMDEVTLLKVETKENLFYNVSLKSVNLYVYLCLCVSINIYIYIY
jgi:hypothetical protein